MEAITHLNGMRVNVTVNATIEEFNFPIRKRSRRLHKKLIRRFGQQTYRKPAIFVMMGEFFIHPSLMTDLKKRFRDAGALL